MKISPRMQFLLKNGLKGLAWMAVLLGSYFLFKEFVVFENADVWVARFYARPYIIYAIYFASEFFFGIIPPELFMIWAIHKAGLMHYVLNIAFLAVVSYAMGYLTFLIGRWLYNRASFRWFRMRFLKELSPLIRKYGIFLIIVAALTPLPWAGTSLFVGSAGYPSGRYLRYALFRLLRFAIYGYVVYQTHQF